MSEFALPADLQALLIELGRTSLEYRSQATYSQPLPDDLATDEYARREAREWCQHYKNELSILGRFAAQSLSYLGEPPNEDFSAVRQGFTSSIITGATRTFLAKPRPRVYLAPLIFSNMMTGKNIRKLLELIRDLGEYANELR